jgi:hypothetical protein
VHIGTRRERMAASILVKREHVQQRYDQRSRIAMTCSATLAVCVCSIRRRSDVTQQRTRAARIVCLVTGQARKFCNSAIATQLRSRTYRSTTRRMNAASPSDGTRQSA